MTDLSAAIANSREALSAERLRELLSYDTETGEFRWRVSVGRAKAGDLAGYDHGTGYRAASVDGRLYRLHRLAWLYVTGEWPPEHIDHVNGVRSDNRWGNLRSASNSQNMQNQRIAPSSNKSSGLLGATWDKKAGRWKSLIMIRRKNIHLGYFDTPEEAHAAYLKAKAELHPFQTITTKDAA